MGEGALLVTGGARVREMRESEARRGARISLYLYLTITITITISISLFTRYFFLAKDARH